MSTSNLKTQGQKGLNGPWQRDVLKLLNAIKTGLITVVGTFTASSTQRTPSRTIVSAIGAGSVAAGARRVTIELSADFSGILGGDNTTTGMLTPGGSYSWEAGQNDDTLGAISYTITAGKIAIQKTI